MKPILGLITLTGLAVAGCGSGRLYTDPGTGDWAPKAYHGSPANGQTREGMFISEVAAIIGHAPDSQKDKVVVMKDANGENLSWTPWNFPQQTFVFHNGILGFTIRND